MSNIGRAPALAFCAVLFCYCAVPAPAGVFTGLHQLNSSLPATANSSLVGPASWPAWGPEYGIFHAAAGLYLQATGERETRIVDPRSQYTDRLGFLRSQVCLAGPLSAQNTCSVPALHRAPHPASSPRRETVNNVVVKIHSPDGVARAFESFLQSSRAASGTDAGHMLLHLDIVSPGVIAPGASTEPAVAAAPLLQDSAGADPSGGPVNLMIAGVALLASRRWKFPD